MEQIKLLVTSAYKENGYPNRDDPVPMDCEVEKLPEVLLDLARKANFGGLKELVISFPDDDTSMMLVELYNGFRE